MKSIFKKIALVLALAMVVTMLPAKAVSAASSDAPDMYKTLRLYLDSGNGITENSDLTGAFQNERYASVWGWRENGYEQVEFASADPNIATVSSKGKVTAVKVGTTTVTATFTGDGVKTVVKECVVTVKRNAAKVGLSADSAKQVEAGFSVGEKVQLTAVRKDAEGNTEWNKTMRDYTTDSVRFKSSDENVFKVTKTTGMLTATGAGEATLTIWTVQSEGKDAATGEYPVGVSKEYKVVVSGFSAEATGAKEITVTGAFNEKSEFSVKRGNVSVPLKAEISEDGKTAKLALETKLRKGTYTVACGNNSADITVEDEYVKEIIVLENGKVATTDNSRTIVFVHYDVLNQYGESVRKTFSVKWNASYGTRVDTDVTNGIIKIVDASATPSPITYGTSVSIVGVHTQGTNVCSVQAMVTAGLENSVGGIEVIGVAKKGTATLLKELPAGFNSNEYVLVYKMLDRLGYAMGYDQTQESNLTFTSFSPLLLNFDQTALGKGSMIIDGVEYGTITLVQGISAKDGGVARAMATSSKTGTKTDFTISVVREQILDSFVLIAPSNIIATNDGEVEIGYEAYDKDGAPVTSFRAMNDALILVGDLTLKEENDGSAKLYYNPGNVIATKDVDGVALLMATVKATGKNSSLTVYVKDAAVASSVRGVGENGGHVTLVKGDSVNLLKSNQWNWGTLFLQWYDQYDRVLKDDTNKFAPNYQIVAKYDGVALTLSGDGGAFNPTTHEISFSNSLTITANNVVDVMKTESIEFSLFDTVKNEVVGGSHRKIAFTVVDIKNVSSFSLSEDGRKIKNNSSDADDTVWFGVTGTLADGRQVKVPDSYVTYSYDQTYNGTKMANTVSGTAISFKAEFTDSDANADEIEVGTSYDFYDLTGKGADGKYSTRLRDVKVEAEIRDRVDNNLVGRAASTIKVGIDAKKPVALQTKQPWWPSMWVEEGKSAIVKANSGTLSTASFECLLKDKYKNNYDREEDLVLGNVTYTVTSYVEAANGLHSQNADSRAVTITGNATNGIVITNAEIGDTFVLTFTYGSLSITVNVTVGSDQNAFLNASSPTAAWR